MKSFQCQALFAKVDMSHQTPSIFHFVISVDLLEIFMNEKYYYDDLLWYLSMLYGSEVAKALTHISLQFIKQLFRPSDYQLNCHEAILISLISPFER